jgi:hypothetical protein
MWIAIHMGVVPVWYQCATVAPRLFLAWEAVAAGNKGGGTCDTERI